MFSNFKHNPNSLWKFSYTQQKFSEMSCLRSMGRIGLYSAVGIAGAYIPLTYVAQLYSCSGPSMKPTISEKGDYVLVDKFSYKILNTKYKHGDIVVTSITGKYMCKRVCAIENETPKYISPRTGKLVCAIVPVNYVWLLGDNRNNSLDSREIGPVPINSIEGRVVMKLSFNPFHVEIFNRQADKDKIQSTTQISKAETKAKDKNKPS